MRAGAAGGTTITRTPSGGSDEPSSSWAFRFLVSCLPFPHSLCLTRPLRGWCRGRCSGIAMSLASTACRVASVTLRGGPVLITYVLCGLSGYPRPESLRGAIKASYPGDGAQRGRASTSSRISCSDSEAAVDRLPVCTVTLTAWFGRHAVRGGCRFAPCIMPGFAHALPPCSWTCEGVRPWRSVPPR